MESSQALTKAKAEEAVKQEKKTFAPLKAATGKADLSEIEKDRKELKFPRTRKYIKVIEKTKDLVSTEQETEVKEQVQEAPLHNKMLGILSECGITGCIIHSIDKYGNIIEHYRAVNEIPEEIREGYLKWDQFPDRIMVEIYTHTLCFVFDDGSVECVDRTPV